MAGLWCGMPRSLVPMSLLSVKIQQWVRLDSDMLFLNVSPTGWMPGNASGVDNNNPSLCMSVPQIRKTTGR
jgi:hypothetical protein